MKIPAKDEGTLERLTVVRRASKWQAVARTDRGWPWLAVAGRGWLWLAVAGEWQTVAADGRLVKVLSRRDKNVPHGLYPKTATEINAYSRQTNLGFMAGDRNKCGFIQKEIWL